MGEGCLVLLPVSLTSLHYVCMQDKAAKTKPRKTPPKQRGTKPTATNRNHTSDQRRLKNQKKQVREPDLGVGAGLGVRIEVGDRGRDEETQGESQTQKGFWGFPST